MSQTVNSTTAPSSPTHEFWVSDPVEEALRKMKLTLNRVGQLVAVVPGQYIEGTVRFGVQNVGIRVIWIEEEAATRMDEQLRGGRENIPRMLGTRWIVEANAEDKSGQAQRSAMERLEDAYLHFDAPDYKPDRLGILPYTIIGIVVAVLLFCLWLLRNPAVQKKLPNAPNPAASGNRS
ncbi:MAG: hypothetical protein SFU56_01305 [Capsulimonadales bacterium]|nr:hypothetical protein [Capsulimonadales bacterium]